MMGGTMRSPLTAIIFAIEPTGNFGALLPLTAACIIAHTTTVLLLRRSILTEKVAAAAITSCANISSTTSKPCGLPTSWPSLWIRFPAG